MDSNCVRLTIFTTSISFESCVTTCRSSFSEATETTMLMRVTSVSSV